MEITAFKKDLQKFCKGLRDKREPMKVFGVNGELVRERPMEYPKAMMTGQQINNDTATINCAGDREYTQEVFTSPELKSLMERHGAEARLVEKNADGNYQIRIYY